MILFLVCSLFLLKRERIPRESYYLFILIFIKKSMKFTLKNYQEKAVGKLMYQLKWIFDWNIDNKEIIFKAPTWSWKTVMMASLLEQLKNEQIWDFAFVWVSVNKLHNQSKKSLENILGVWAFNFYNLENVREKLNKNDILFINWQSINRKATRDNKNKDIKKWDYTNIFMSENETGRNLPNFIENTLLENRKIILIIDESHLHLNNETEKLINNILKPFVRIWVSATPKKNKTVEVKLSEVIEEEIIKKEVVINEKFSEINLLEKTGEEIIIDQALQKQKELRELYLEENKNIKPLVLIQIPWKSEKTSVLEKDEIEKVEKILKEKYNITRENQKLAVYLSEDKTDNLDDIADSNSQVEVLIFKQAIATGWDCPRAQILVMFREIKSITFEIQTVWRIMRMPELKYYKNESLNKAYVFTNFWDINISDWEASKYIRVKQAKKRDDFENIILPNSVYLKRLDQNTLAPSEDFAQVFYNVFLETFWWNRNNLPSLNYDLLNEEINLNKNFKAEILLENSLIWLDEITKKIKVWETKVDEKIIEFQFKKVLEKFVSGFNKTKSMWILKQAIYNSFNHFLWFIDKTQIDIQRIIITNEKYFEDIVSRAIKKFEPLRQEKINKKYPKEIYDFSILENEVFSDRAEIYDFKKYFQTPAYFVKDSNLELDFAENYLEKNIEIEFWYKNWVSNKVYFWIEYFNIDKNKESIFYPDFIVKYKGWKIWIFDTKSWNTASPMETRLKAEALQKYIIKNNSLSTEGFTPLFWWIIIKNKNNFYINSNERYTFENDNLAGWDKI